MAKIRKDLEGIVVAVHEGATHILRAGDKVPDGVLVGDHVLAKKSDGDKTDGGAEGGNAVPPPETGDPGTADAGALAIPPKGGAGSGADAWRDYATKAAAAAGVNIEIPEGAKREDIVAALESAQIPTE